MNGLGFYIWKMSAMPPFEVLLPVLKRVGVRWLAIKVQDGLTKYNTTGGNDKPLIGFMDALRADGIEVWGWGFIYPNPVVSPGGQAGVASERIQKLKLAGYLIDAEHVVKGEVNCPWKTSPYRKASALTFMNQLDVNKQYPVALSSYRFPTSAHSEFPTKQFVNHERSKFIAPQMYWEGSHNPREQLVRCMAEYRQINPELPVVPFGSAYGANVRIGDKVFYWEPTVEDIREFIQAAKDLGCKAWGFWSLDWILAKGKTDWLEAMADPGGSTGDDGGSGSEDPGSGGGEPVEPGALKFRVLSKVLNIRSGPGTGYQDLGDLHRGEIVTGRKIDGIDVWTEIAPGKWACVKQGKYRFLEEISD